MTTKRLRHTVMVQKAADMVGGIEAGGTKFVCTVGTGPDDLAARVEFPTTTPAETIPTVVAFFHEQAKFHHLTGVGIASFGPVDLDPASPRYGYITSTPKHGWRNTDLMGPVRAVGVPVAFDTDVNAAALGEKRWGAAQDVDTFLYITVGTGIGGGGLVQGRLIHGLLHPEMGHMRVPHDREADPFAGSCPFHGDCLEGLAAGAAIEARWGGRGEHLPADHPAWPLEARYLALGLTNVICALSPQLIVLGGGVMQQPGLLPLIRQYVVELLNGYIQVAAILDDIDHYIVPARLGANAGALGAMALATTVSGEW
jgi:fructokinase